MENQTNTETQKANLAKEYETLKLELNYLNTLRWTDGKKGLAPKIKSIEAKLKKIKQTYDSL